MIEEFMPVIMADLIMRWKRELDTFYEREKTLSKMIQIEKMASLGQMAAGISHELNNAIAVMTRNTEWLIQFIPEIMNQYQVDFVDEFARWGYQGTFAK